MNATARSPGTVRLLVFYDIYNDLSTLRRLIETDADYYVAVGDLLRYLSYG